MQITLFRGLFVYQGALIRGYKKMGCVSSKHLKQQASIDGWTSPASRATTPRAKAITANHAVVCCHRHFVSLTSTSYGSLKIESPKPAEMRLTHDRAAFSSLNDMYGNLRTSEMVDSAHITQSHDINRAKQSTLQTCAHKSSMQLKANDQWANLGSLGLMDSAHIKPFCNVNNVQNTFSPCVYESPSLLGENQQCNIHSAEFVRPETINVKEMMVGLEEAAPSHGSSPAKQAASISSAPKAKTLKQSIHTKKKPFTREHIGSFRNSSTPAAAEWSDDECGKENSSPFHGQQRIMQTLPEAIMGTAPVLQVSNSPFKSATSAWSPSCHIHLLKLSQPTSKSASSLKTNMARDIQPVRRENIVARRAAVERGSPRSGVQMSTSSPEVSTMSSPAAQSIQYVSTNGKVKLTPQVQHENDAASTRIPPNPSRSRRLDLGGGFASVESSSPTFDPDLVASYEKALRTVSQGDWNANHADMPKGNQYSPATTAKTDVGRPFFWSSKSKSMHTAELDRQLYNPFECFKVKCPPGGEEAVVLYTTTLRGIRKTFEDCNMAREILQSFSLSIDERDVSMHLEFLNELRELMERVVSVPRMFIKGRYIGGIEDVVKLHEDGKLSELVQGLPKKINGGSCDGCGGVRFVPCLECSGSCKMRSQEGNRVTRCPDCNENGLIQCPICT